MRVLGPASVEEACEMLARERDDSGRAPTPIAGGTDLLVEWPVRWETHDRTFMDLGRIAGLRAMAWRDGWLELGALTTYWDVVTDPRMRREFPVLVAAARTVGAVQIQARATWAGNIVNASPAADGVPALMACDARVILADCSGQTEVSLDEFYKGYKQMARRPDQLVVAIRVPRRPADVAVFEKIGARAAQAITKVGAAVVRFAGEGPGRWRIVANSVAPTVRRCRGLERTLDSGSPIRGPKDVSAALAGDIAPIDDIRSTAAYRAEVLARVLYHALKGRAPSVL
jgi:CO/xanthine dehydrogenase FAD-binding subunit